MEHRNTKKLIKCEYYTEVSIISECKTITFCNDYEEEVKSIR